MFSYNKTAGQGQFQRERFGPDLARLTQLDLSILIDKGPRKNKFIPLYIHTSIRQGTKA